MAKTFDLSEGQFADLEENAENFGFFFQLTHNLTLTSFARTWVDMIYDAQTAEKGVIIIDFRGSAKSTVMGAFIAYYIGHHPNSTNAIIRANDDSASESGRHVAGIIAKNPAWRLFFPQIVPDVGIPTSDKMHGSRGAKWSRTGYEVIDTSMPESNWRQRQAERATPTLLCLSYESKGIMGRRITGKLLFDDVHDEANTASESELEHLKRKVLREIFPLRTKTAQTIFIGNAWLPNDIHEEQRNTGEYLFRRGSAENPDGTATWPEEYPTKLLESRKKELGEAAYAQMYLCDASMMAERSFTFQQYAHDMIKESWPHRGGVDYASLLAGQRKTRHQSHFAIAYVAMHPDGFWIIHDGVLKQVTQLDAENILIASQDRFPSWMGSVVELDGKGEEFYASIYTRNKNLRLTPMKTGGIKKEIRWLDHLQPKLGNGSLRVSTGDSYFLQMLRELLTYYPNVSRGHPGRDAMDAVFWAMRPELVSNVQRHGIVAKKKQNAFFTLARSKLRG